MAGREENVVVVPTGRHGLPPDIVTAHQRERLLAATIEVVAKRGYRGTSVDHIVKGARVGYVAFYELFEGKEDCFLAAFERIVEETREELAASVSTEAPWAAQICAGLAVLVEAIVSDPSRARVALVEVQAAGPTAFTRFEETIDTALPKLREGRTLNSRAAAFSETLEETIAGGIVWIIHQRLVKAESAQVRDLVPVLAQVALSPYLGETEAHRIASTVEG